MSSGDSRESTQPADRPALTASCHPPPTAGRVQMRRRLLGHKSEDRCRPPLSHTEQEAVRRTRMQTAVSSGGRSGTTLPHEQSSRGRIKVEEVCVSRRRQVSCVQACVCMYVARWRN